MSKLDVDFEELTLIPPPPSEITKQTFNPLIIIDEKSSFANSISNSLDSFLAILIYPSIISDSLASFSILNLTSYI